MSTPASYRMIGADGREYGPIPAEQLRQWIQEGRADRYTKLSPEGETWWKPLGQFSEFADLLPQPASPGVAAGGAAGPVSSAPPTITPMPTGGTVGSYTPVGARPKVDGMAIAGLICSGFGLIPCCCCGGPLFSGLGLAFSLVGLNSINRDPVSRTGRGLAIAGIVMGALGLLFFIAFLMSSPWNSAPFQDWMREIRRL